MSSKPTKPSAEEDLEATAELPAVEFAPAAGRDLEATFITDVYAVPVIPVGAPELADSLREAEQQLKRERARIEEMDARLRQAAERQVQLEAQLGQAAGRQMQLEAQLAEAAGRHAELEARYADARGRHEVLEAQMQSRAAGEREAVVMRHGATDIAELRRSSQRQLEALASWEGFRGMSQSLVTELEVRNAQLESQVASLSESLRALERVPAQGESREVENRTLKAELAALKAQFGELQGALAGMRDRPQPEQKAEAAPARPQRQEAAAPPAAAPPVKERKAAAQAPAEAPLRVLVRHDGGADVVHPVGRRTTIGRMPDNDIQLDTANVSRHHAVVLCGAEHCIIEDLNSTNGVLVNGRRVTRQILRDGDVLGVGKTEFRFQQRS